MERYIRHVLTVWWVCLPVSTAAFSPIPARFARTHSPIVHSVPTSGLSLRESSLSSVTSDSGTSLGVATSQDEWWQTWSAEHGIWTNENISVRLPRTEERGKGGVTATKNIAALEVISRIPRNLIVAASPKDMSTRAVEAATNAKNCSWAVDLTAAALVALHPEVDATPLEGAEKAKQEWVQGWVAGGWATDGADLGSEEEDWGPKCVTGSLLATGSDNDVNVYAKFRFPCHPVLHRASLGLALLTGSDDSEISLEALSNRGRTYRAMRDALLELVTTPSPERKGSMRERRAWDVADVLSRTLSRVTMLQFNDDDSNTNEDSYSAVVVPLHERLDHSEHENTKLVVASNDEEIWLVATRDITAGETITRNYNLAPRLDGDTSEGALRLLLQFGLPPNVWPSA